MNILAVLSIGSVLVSLASAAATPVKRDEASTIWADIEQATTCAGCEVGLFSVCIAPTSLTYSLTISFQTLLVALQALAHLGNDDFTDVITEVCILAGVSKQEIVLL